MPRLAEIAAAMPTPTVDAVDESLVNLEGLSRVAHRCGEGPWNSSAAQIQAKFVANLHAAYASGGQISAVLAADAAQSGAATSALAEDYEDARAATWKDEPGRSRAAHTDALFGLTRRATTERPDEVPTTLPVLTTAIVLEAGERQAPTDARNRGFVLTGRIGALARGAGRAPSANVQRALGAMLDAYLAKLPGELQLITPIWSKFEAGATKLVEVAQLRRDLTFDGGNLRALLLWREAEHSAATLLQDFKGARASPPKSEKPEARGARFAADDDKLDERLASAAEDLSVALETLSDREAKLGAVGHLGTVIGDYAISEATVCKTRTTADEFETCARIEQWQYASRALAEVGVCLAVSAATDRHDDCRRRRTEPTTTSICQPAKWGGDSLAPTHVGAALSTFLVPINLYERVNGASNRSESRAFDLTARTSSCDLEALADLQTLDGLGVTGPGTLALVRLGAGGRFHAQPRDFAKLVARAHRFADRVVDDACSQAGIEREKCSVATMPKDAGLALCARAVVPWERVRMAFEAAKPRTLDALSPEIEPALRLEIERLGRWSHEQLPACPKGGGS
jgi:hypothetical protein